MNGMSAIYNNISRFEVSFSTVNKMVTSQNIINLFDTEEGTKHAVSLLSKLILFKYNRQAEFENVAGKDDEQEELWKQIENDLKSNKDSKIELHHLMVFVKDNNYVFKNKLPLEFKQLLAGLSEAKRGAILNEFAPDSRHIMCAYLGDATGQDWSTHIEEVKDSVTVDSQEIKENFIILEQIHNAKNLKDVRWKYDIQNSPHSYIADGCRRYKMPVETLIAKLNTLDYDSYKLAEPVHAQAPSFLKPSNNQPFYPVDKDKVFYALFSKSEL